MAREGRAAIQILRADGNDIAVQMCAVIDRQLQVVKTSFDADYSKFGAGKLLLDESMREWCPHHDIDGVNMVTGLQWHLQWKPRCITTYGVWLFRPGLRGLIARLRDVPVGEEREVVPAQVRARGHGTPYPPQASLTPIRQEHPGRWPARWRRKTGRVPRPS